MLPYDIAELIFNQLDLIWQLRFVQTNKMHIENLQIINFGDIPCDIRKKLTNKYLISTPPFEMYKIVSFTQLPTVRWKR